MILNINFDLDFKILELILKKKRTIHLVVFIQWIILIHYSNGESLRHDINLTFFFNIG